MELGKILLNALGMPNLVIIYFRYQYHTYIFILFLPVLDLLGVPMIG
jgi:hypothetical protein